MKIGCLQHARLYFSQQGLVGWLARWLARSLGGWLTSWLAGALASWLARWLAGQLAGSLARWSASWLAGSLASSLARSLAHWFAWLACSLAHVHAGGRARLCMNESGRARACPEDGRDRRKMVSRDTVPCMGGGRLLRWARGGCMCARARADGGVGGLSANGSETRGCLRKLALGANWNGPCNARYRICQGEQSVVPAY